MGKLIEIYITENSGSAMSPVESAELEAGQGIVGDRYHAGRGTFSSRLEGKPQREVTLIEVEEIENFNQVTGLSLANGDPRRNLVVEGVRLNDLVGKEFRVGEVVLEGIKLCEPCTHLAATLTPEVLPHMVGRGGLRAGIIKGGKIQLLDLVRT